MFSFLRSLANPAPGIAPGDAVAQAARGELTVIDVREPAELAASGRAKGALNVPLGAIRTKCDPTSAACLAELSPQKPVALYCASGARSGMAAAQLRAMGYATVYNLGSLGDWRAGGGAVVR